jgi:predicted enzyme related to lactoylglutathione lyase
MDNTSQMDSSAFSQSVSDSEEAPLNLPPLQRDAHGNVDLDSVPDVIQWFLDFDNRVAIIKHPNVEQVFQWKQEQSRNAGEQVFAFNRAEDRLAIGIIQALAENSTERALHSWISQLLNALDAASKANEAAAEAYKLDLAGGGSVVKEAEKIPSARGRRDFLINCWIETLCTAEARVLGWLYKELYGRAFAP